MASPLLPPDTQTGEWECANLAMWNDPHVVQLAGEYPERNPYSIQLAPLEAKALHVFGLLLLTFDAAGHMLYFGSSGPWANFYPPAYLLACTAVELLARCKRGDPDLRHGTNEALKDGFRIVGLERVGAGDMVYDEDDLVALRNLAAHGQGLASVGGKRRPVRLHIELLNGFPEHLTRAFDDYYNRLRDPSDPHARKTLARSGAEPVSYYDKRPRQAFVPPNQYAYENIFISQKMPGEVLRNTDWTVYRAE
jgi:hypothetical protein